MSSRPVVSCLLLAIVAGGVLLSALPAQGQLFERMYGYRPRTYGYWPSAYVFPRYGFHHGEIYTRHIGYGEPGFGDRGIGGRDIGGRGAGQSAPACAANSAPACPAGSIQSQAQPELMVPQGEDAEFIPTPAVAQP